MARITSFQRMAATSRRPGGPVRFGAPLGRGGVIGPAGPLPICGGDLVFFLPRRQRGRGGGGWDTALQRISTHAPRPPGVARLAPGGGLPLAGVVTRRPRGAHASVRDLFASHCLLFPRFVSGGGWRQGPGDNSHYTTLPHPHCESGRWRFLFALRSELGLATPLCRRRCEEHPRRPRRQPPPRVHTHPRNPRRVARLWWGWRRVGGGCGGSRVRPSCRLEWPSVCCLPTDDVARVVRGRAHTGVPAPAAAAPRQCWSLCVVRAHPLFSTFRAGSGTSLRRFSRDAGVAPVVSPLFCAGAAWPRSCIRGSHRLRTWRRVPILLVGPFLSPPRHLSLLLPPLLQSSFC